MFIPMYIFKQTLLIFYSKFYGKNWQKPVYVSFCSLNHVWQKLANPVSNMY